MNPSVFHRSAVAAGALKSVRQGPVSRGSQQGVALVITLILLVVITTLTVAFLALTSRETSAVTSSVNTTDSEQAAAAVLERAKAQVLSSFLKRNVTPSGSTNADVTGPDLMVSIARDVSPSTALDLLRTDASPPVFIWTNKAVKLPSAVENRFYLDLNRNGRFEPSGFVPSTNELNAPILDGAGNPITEWRIGDPVWIGILRDPTQPHSSSNHFIARYAFIIVPAGRTLDMNWIHNDTKDVGNGVGLSGYLRNQGVGTYELNLAAFLADVNANAWWPSYFYNSNAGPNEPSKGPAFNDAHEILTNRFYLGDKRRVPPATALFASLGAPPLNYFSFDHINAYADGPFAPFGSSAATVALRDNDDPTLPWPGADSYKHYYTIHDFWNASQLPGFVARLSDASSKISTEDRYTYYRILAQLGTDSVPEREDRLNINYRNITNNPITVMVKGAATNFVPWTATEFFNAAADRMLTNEFFPYGLTNVRLSGIIGEGIPVFTNNSLFVGGNPNNVPLYSPRIHQLLQLTANIYEATLSNETSMALVNLPTVFRPLFDRRGNDIYITNYVWESPTAVPTFKDRIQNPNPNAGLKWYELDNAPNSISTDDNFFDIPILFGARKGIPNFNEFTVHTLAEFKRNLEVRKDANGKIVSTNQTFIMSVSNYFVAEIFNSYGGVTNFYPNYPNAQYSYPRPLEWILANVSTSTLTNQSGLTVTNSTVNGNPAIYPASSWTNGYRLTPVMTSATLTSSVFYMYPTPRFVVFNNLNPSEPLQDPRTNRWGMTVSNRFRCFLFDNGRLVDCVTSTRMNTRFDVSAALDRRLGAGGAQAFEQLWSNRVIPGRAVTDGIQNQLDISQGFYGAQPTPVWQDYGDLAASGYSTIAAAIRGFANFLTNNTPNVFTAQAPFSPHARVLQISSWQANDPLVHSTVYDLYDPPATNYEVIRLKGRDPYFTLTNTVLSSPGQKNQRYNPWGGRDGNSQLPSDYDLSEKDPGVFTPDYWDFPTQRFPNIGWLGRVHRGTPWQTVYLKSEDPNYSSTLRSARNANAWWQHAGAAYMEATFPTNDWRLLDLFTAAIHPNATRGRLSINQTNLAAWSAVFSGVRTTVLINDGNNIYNPSEVSLQPHSVDLLSGDTNVPLALLRIVQGINRTRMNPVRGNFVNNFTRLSDLMAVPELTLQSPLIPIDGR
ncbi:MAG: hypothetical protein QOF48_1997, partial [Verrucomicrobiota bacterium]